MKKISCLEVINDCYKNDCNKKLRKRLQYQWNFERNAGNAIQNMFPMIDIWNNSDTIGFANKFVRASFCLPLKYLTNRYGICAMTKQPCTCDTIKYQMKEKEKRERKQTCRGGRVLINVSVWGCNRTGDNTPVWCIDRRVLMEMQMDASRAYRIVLRRRRKQNGKRKRITSFAVSCSCIQFRRERARRAPVARIYVGTFSRQSRETRDAISGALIEILRNDWRFAA